MKSKIHIDYKKPLNYKDEWAHLFRPDYKYKTVDLKVKELSNVFVSHYGLAVKNGFLVKGCAPNLGFSTYDKSAYYKHWRKGIEHNLVSKYGSSLPSLKLDDNRKYLLIHSPWFSYYFWLSECLPRLLMVKDRLDDLVLLYPEGWDKVPFVTETLELFPNLQKQILPEGVHAFVKNLVLPEVKPWTPMFIPEQIMAVRELIFTENKKRNIKVESNGKLYLSREDSPRKNFSNKEEVNKLLLSKGFQSFQMTGLSIFEQAELMQNTKQLVSITGAGMVNFMFLSKGATVLDMTNEKYLHHKKYKFHFWKLCNIVDANYLTQLCEHENDPKVPRFSLQNLIPNMDDLNLNLELMDSI